MNNYYDELIEEIEQLIEEGHIDEASFTVEKELRMPYIPQETETKLRKFRRELAAMKAEKASAKEDSMDELLNQLKGDDLSQLRAASALSKRSLRECIDAISDYLSSDPCPEAAALIIEAIAQQQIKESFVYIHDGIEAEFYGDSLVPCTESAGFRCALKYLEDWVSNDNPSMFVMCRTLLIREVYMFLPLSYEADEGRDLALHILEQVSMLNDEGLTYREVLSKYGKDSKVDLKS